MMVNGENKMLTYAKNISVNSREIQRIITTMRHGLKYTLLALVACLCLSSCSVLNCLFNGEGYCGLSGGKAPVDEPANPNTTPSGSPANVPTFFWNQENYNCMTTAGIREPSYKGVIKLISSSQFEAYRDKCSLNASPYIGDVSELEILGDIVGFGDGIYEKRTDKP